MITFSRKVVIDFGFFEKKRTLQEKNSNSTDAYTPEEMKMLEELIVVKYETATEEGEGEIAQLIKKEVIRATPLEIEYQMSYSLPLAVSRNPQDPDLLVFEFREDVISDPLTDIEVNKGKALVVALPRQIDAA